MSNQSRIQFAIDELSLGVYKSYLTKETALLLYHYIKNKIKSQRILDLNNMLPEKARTENKDYEHPEVINSINKFPSSSIIGIIISNSFVPVYICLVLAHIINCSLLSLVYPVSLFCYALLEEVRPKKIYWQFLIMYTIIVLIMKALAKSTIASSIFSEEADRISHDYRLGLYLSSNGNYKITYYLFDVMILLFTVSHIICLMLQGLYHQRETEIENIFEASHRITNIAPEENQDDKKPRKNSFDTPKIKKDDSMKKVVKDSKRQNDFHQKVRENMVSGKNEDFRQLLSFKKTMISSKENHDHFIPKPKQVKPGYDMYTYIAFSQILIIFYTILFFTSVERDYTNSLPENYTFEQFSSQTVFVVFILILVISFDRHIYLTKKFEYLKEREKPKGLDKNDMDYFNPEEDQDEYFEDEKKKEEEVQERMMTQAMKVVLNLNPRKVMNYSMRSALDANQNSLLFKKEGGFIRQTESITIEEHNRKLKPLKYPIVSKYLLQWFLIIIVHFGLCWYLPSASNYEIQSHYYCDYNLNNRSQCNEFTTNPFLMIYYILFVFYFTVSALQLNYGYPELISGNFLMKKSTSTNGLGYTIFQYVPFLIELKVITEWFETKTALGLLQWMKFQMIYGDLFQAK